MGFHANGADVIGQLFMTLKLLFPIWGIAIAIMAVKEIGENVLTKIFGDEWYSWYGLKPPRKSSNKGRRASSKSSGSKERKSEAASTRPRRTDGLRIDTSRNQTIRVENGKVTITYDKPYQQNPRNTRPQQPKKDVLIPAVRDTANTIAFFGGASADGPKKRGRHLREVYINQDRRSRNDVLCRRQISPRDPSAGAPGRSQDHLQLIEGVRT